MKNQYVGDIGDYGKYGLLSYFARNGIGIGINWYLTQNDNSKVGSSIDYLHKESESCYDSNIYQALRKIVDTGNRNVKEIENKK